MAFEEGERVCNDQATAHAALFVGDLKLIRPAIALQKSCVRGEGGLDLLFSCVVEEGDHFSCAVFEHMGPAASAELEGAEHGGVPQTPTAICRAGAKGDDGG
jgi:hypothetical protein